MARTDEQREADDRLQAAIDHWLKTNELSGGVNGEEQRILTDYVVFAATRGFSIDEDDDVTGYPFILRPGMPLYCAVGLAEVSLANMLAVFNREDED